MEEQIINIKNNLKISWDRQKSYVGKGISFKEFEVGEHVFLKMRENNSSLKLGSCKKLVARYCGPFNILRRIGLVSYDLALPANIKYHNVLHVSLLEKYIHYPNHITDWNVIQVELEGDSQVQLVRILDKKVNVHKNRAMGQVKVQWIQIKITRIASMLQKYVVTWHIKWIGLK